MEQRVFPLLFVLQKKQNQFWFCFCTFYFFNKSPFLKPVCFNIAIRVPIGISFLCIGTVVLFLEASWYKIQ